MPDPVYRSDAILPPHPNQRRGSWFHMRHRGLRYVILRSAYLSSILLTILLPLAAIIPTILYPWMNAISFTFIMIQIAEKCAENHLRNREAFADFGFSLVPAIVGTLEIAQLRSAAIPPESWSMILWWTAYAWLDVIGGYAIHNTVLNAPYAREEDVQDQ